MLREWFDHSTSGETENQTEENRDRKSRQRLTTNRQQHECQAETLSKRKKRYSIEIRSRKNSFTYNQNCNETCNGCVPVTITGGFTNENRIKNKIAKTEFDAT